MLGGYSRGYLLIFFFWCTLYLTNCIIYLYFRKQLHLPGCFSITSAESKFTGGFQSTGGHKISWQCDRTVRAGDGTTSTCCNRLHRAPVHWDPGKLILLPLFILQTNSTCEWCEVHIHLYVHRGKESEKYSWFKSSGEGVQSVIIMLLWVSNIFKWKPLKGREGKCFFLERHTHVCIHTRTRRDTGNMIHNYSDTSRQHWFDLSHSGGRDVK